MRVDAMVKKVAVIGAGVMGSGLAQLFAQRGYPVGLNDITEGSLGRALRRARSNLELQVERGWITAGEMDATLRRIKTSIDLGEVVAGADFVIEAVPEDLELKKRVFKQLGELAPPHAVLAYNTSTFNVMAEVGEKIASRVLITHFFNPAQLIPLVEVVKGEETSEEVVNLTVELMRSAGKLPLLIKRYLPGFVVNRFQLALNSMAYAILQEGVLEPEEIDRAIESSISLRLAVNGPFATMDLGGLDVVAASARTMGFEPPPPLQELVEKGELGVKTGKGFYDYGGRDEDDILRRRDWRLMLLLEAWNAGREGEA